MRYLAFLIGLTALDHWLKHRHDADLRRIEAYANGVSS